MVAEGGEHVASGSGPGGLGLVAAICLYLFVYIMYLFRIYFVFPLYLAQARSRQWECEWARWPGGSCGTASPSLAGGKTAWREPPPSFLSLPNLPYHLLGVIQCQGVLFQ